MSEATGDPPAHLRGGPGFVAAERRGHPERHFVVAVSVGAMALAWTRQEGAPQGAAVVADREIRPLGRLGQLWPRAPEATLAVAVVLRPSLPAELADAVWLVAGLVGADGASAAAGRTVGVMWPDALHDAGSGETVGWINAEVQLGPGRVTSAVVSLRFDLVALGLGPDGREALLDEVLGAFDQRVGRLADGAEGCAAMAGSYDRSCLLLGKRVKATLLPRGEARGVARRVDEAGRLELVSATGMVERVGVDMLRQAEVVGGGS